MASNISLVESASCVPLIPLLGELMNSNVIATSIFLKYDYLFFLRCLMPHAGDPARCQRALSLALKSRPSVFSFNILFKLHHNTELKLMTTLGSSR